MSFDLTYSIILLFFRAIILMLLTKILMIDLFEPVLVIKIL